MRGILMSAMAAMAVVAGTAAMAAPVDAETAKGMLFKPTGMIFYPVEPQGLDAEAAGKVTALQGGMDQQMAAFEAGGYGYYGAMAVPTGGALKPESLVVLAGLHSPGAAQAAVLAQCKSTHKAECTVIGLMLPQGYKTREMTLSAAATTGVRGGFSGPGPHFLAYSPATAGFAVAKGPGADAVALKACNAASGGKNDCVIGVAED